MDDELSEAEHKEMQENDRADAAGRIYTYFEYKRLGFEDQKAMRMAGLKPEVLKQFPDLVHSLTNKT